MSAEILRADGLCIQYDNAEPLLYDVNLSLDKEAAISIRGDVGIGKTSLLRVLGLLSKPRKGHVCIDSATDCSALPRAELNKIISQYFAYVFQAPELMMQWSVIENISLPLIAKGYAKAERKEQTYEFCEAMGLAHLAEKPVYTLSGGQKHLVGIAMALAKQPQILVADELTANLDPLTKIYILERLIKQARERKITLIVATHDGADKRLFDRNYMIKDKKLHMIKQLVL